MLFNALFSSCSSNARRVKSAFAFSLVFLGAFIVASSAFSQPPAGDWSGGRPGMRGENMGPGMRGDRGGRWNRGGNAQGEGARQEGEQGQDQKKPEPKIALEDALKNANGTTPITLNQNEFTAMDGVKLSGVYFKGKGDTDTPVIIILHDLNGKREDWQPVAQQLAQLGYGVLLPDLRGSGESGALRRGPGNNNPPNDRPQAQEQISQMDIMAMIQNDRIVWFNFLKYLNNAEYCNIKKTIIVGSGFGAALASSWAKDDWSSKEKPSQNVVGLVLLSPDVENDMNAKRFNCLISLETLKRRAKFPTMGALLFVGKLDKEKFEAAKEIQQKFGGKVVDEKTPMEDRACPMVAINTEQQGDALLKYESFGVPTTLAQYVQVRLNKLPKKRSKWEEFEEKQSRR